MAFASWRLYESRLRLPTTTAILYWLIISFSLLSGSGWSLHVNCTRLRLLESQRALNDSRCRFCLVVSPQLRWTSRGQTGS